MTKILQRKQLLILGLILAASGCGPEIVGGAARTSLASFLTTVFSSAVNNALVN